MTVEELERTEAFINRLMEEKDSFEKFLSNVASNLNTSPLTHEVFKSALTRVYRANNALPPESDIVQYIFDDLIIKQAAFIVNSDLSYRLNQLFIEHKREIASR